MTEPARASWDRATRALETGDLADARRWLERTRRLVPADETVALALGGLLARMGDTASALATLRSVRAPQAYIVRAAAHLAAGDAVSAAESVSSALQSLVPTAVLESLASRVAEQSGAPGWIGLDRSGHVRGRSSGLTLDGREVGPELPPGWDRARLLEAPGALGSPLPVQRLLALAGVAEAAAGGLSGWAYHPAEPDADPDILVRGRAGTIRLTARDPAEAIADLPPLARPRRFSLADAAALGPILAVTDLRGVPLLGSPVVLRPRAPRPKSAAPSPPERGVSVVIPVHGGGSVVRSCLEAALAHSDGAAIHVIADGPPGPALDTALATWAESGRIQLTRHRDPLGYPRSANEGIRAAAGRDVVLLNSDTRVPPGWLPRLRRAAYAAPDIATATPFTNEGSIVSYPRPEGGNPVPDPETCLAIDRVAQAVNEAQVADLPVGVGFCLYLRRDALDRLGPLRPDLFAQGYGEETEFCLRARRAGWRQVAALDLFVPHAGGHSFSLGAAALRRRNEAIVARLHPGFPALVAAHHAADPLFAARRRLEAALWAATGPSVLLITHAAGGGTEEFVVARAEALRTAGLRPILLRPAPGGVAIDAAPNLRFALSSELPELAALLRPTRVVRLELHHLLGHDRSLLRMAALLDAPLETWVHDAAPFCPRLSLIGVGRRYCGEPDLAGCATCVAKEGHFWHEDLSVAALRSDWEALLAASRRVVVPTLDGARRLRRHFPAISPEIVPLEDDGALPPLAASPSGALIRVAVPGGIGVEKGFDILRACVADAAARALPLEYVVCGYTEDDEALMAAGPAFVTGPYAPAEAVDLLRAQAADCAFIPSIWPETWCLALSRAWQAGLFAVAFDLGAQAERIRATGRGTLLPLALPPASVNDALLRLARLRRSGQSPQP